jgi:hypothetical protein
MLSFGENISISKRNEVVQLYLILKILKSLVFRGRKVLNWKNPILNNLDITTTDKLWENLRSWLSNRMYCTAWRSLATVWKIFSSCERSMCFSFQERLAYKTFRNILVTYEIIPDIFAWSCEEASLNSGPFLRQ